MHVRSVVDLNKEGSSKSSLLSRLCGTRLAWLRVAWRGAIFYSREVEDQRQKPRVMLRHMSRRGQELTDALIAGVVRDWLSAAIITVFQKS